MLRDFDGVATRAAALSGGCVRHRGDVWRSEHKVDACGRGIQLTQTLGAV